MHLVIFHFPLLASASAEPTLLHKPLFLLSWHWFLFVGVFFFSCDPLNLITVACMNMDEGLFSRPWTVEHWLHHWRKWLPLSQQPLASPSWVHPTAVMSSLCNGRVMESAYFSESTPQNLQWEPPNSKLSQKGYYGEGDQVLSVRRLFIQLA